MDYYFTTYDQRNLYHTLSRQLVKRISKTLFDNPDDQDIWVRSMIRNGFVGDCLREMCKTCEESCELKPKEQTAKGLLLRKWMLAMNGPLDNSENAADRISEHRKPLRSLEDDYVHSK